MTRWRLALTALLFLAVGVPLALPFLDLFQYPQAWLAWREAPRLWLLTKNTLLLIGGTLAVALPAGIVGAILLYRTDLPLRGLLRFLTILGLFVPLPLFASAWQATLGTGGWLPLPLWSTAPPGDPDFSPTGILWKPWAQGIGAAVWVHAVAGLPWVVWLVGQALGWVERELEEDALLVAGPWRVLWHVTLPRCRAAILAAGLWVALQTATEMSISDIMSVRTFAEEVYTQFVRPERDGTHSAAAVLARAVAVSVPMVLVSAILVVWAARRWERTLPPLESRWAEPVRFALGGWRWPCLIGALLIVGVLAGVPVGSLVWKAGLADRPEPWSAATVGHHLTVVFRVHGRMVAGSLALAGLTGAVAAALALVCCWLAVEARWFHTLLLAFLAAVWATPGPVVGVGLKDTIEQLLRVEDVVAESAVWPAKVQIPYAPGDGIGKVPEKPRKVRPFRVGLYDGPSYLPILWAWLVRFLPFAVAVLWPVVRMLPRELRDAARLDGARPWQELLHVVRPLTLPACLRAGLAVGVLALGELSASKLVATPGCSTFTQEVFMQMHFGVGGNLAALCLVLLAMVLAGGAAVAGLAWVTRRVERNRAAGRNASCIQSVCE